jgi:hypothetical protein
MLAALALLFVAAPARAPAETAPATRGVDDTAKVAEAASHLKKGDAQIDARKFGAARREYRAAAKLMREEGGVPHVAMRRIANTFYFQGRYNSAMRTLDKLAREAAEHGDLVTQAWAIADAAWVAGKAGARLDVEKRVAKLEKLLNSPFLPGHVQRDIRARRLDDYYALAQR